MEINNSEQDIEDGFYERYRIVTDRGQEPYRIDKFLADRIEKISRTKIQYAADANCILVNNKPVKSNYKIKPHDEIVILLSERTNEYSVLPENIPLDILFEDDHLLLVNKPAGMVVHPGLGNFTGTLVNALLYHYEQLPKKEGEAYRPGLVHRIDKNTTGIVIIAKNELSLQHLAKQFFNHTINRKYYALVWGEFDHEEGTINANIGRHPRLRKLFTVLTDDTGKHAITHYKVLQNLGYVSLIECRLETGRTHQIRVHMQSIGHSVFNDDTYGGNRILRGTIYTKYKQFIDNCFTIIPRQALHAKSLGFTHPATGKEMYF
ncbi:MAG: RluA family pseudouridine synthase, partial [Fimbriimonadaceae bacterium]|nr:RluA family pseudouridine synthase [Chitinophagales bacterium]